MLKKLFVCTIAAALFAAAQENSVNRVLAVVDKKVITAMDVQNYCIKDLQKLSQKLHGEELQKQTAQLKKLALEQLIDHELIYLEFKNLKAKVPPDMLQDRIDEITMQAAGGDAILFEEQLFKEGMTMTEFREKLSRDIAINLLLNNRIRNGISIPDSAIEKDFNENKHVFIKPIRYHIAVIMVAGNDKSDNEFQAAIAKIQKCLDDGLAFDEIARKHSDGANAANGGDQGWMDNLNAELKKAVEELETGKASRNPVRIGSNAYFVKVIELDGGGIPTLDAPLKKTIRQKLEREEESKRYKAFIADLYMRYAVKRMDNVQ